MAVLRNIAGEARDIPLAGRIVKDGEDFEVDDDTFAAHSFSPDLFKVVEPPTKKTPKPKAAAVADDVEKKD
jgi:hypothetical protein